MGGNILKLFKLQWFIVLMGCHYVSIELGKWIKECGNFENVI